MKPDQWCPGTRRVLMVTNRSLSRRNAEAVHVSELARALARKGYNVTLVSPATGVSTLETDGVRHVPAPVGTRALAGALRYEAWLWRRLPALAAEQGDVDTVLYVRYGFPLTAPLLWARRAGKPCVLEVNGYPGLAELWGWRKLLYPVMLVHFMLCCRLAARVVTVTRGLAETVYRLTGCPVGRVTVIPNGADPEVFRPAPVEEALGALELPLEALAVTYVGTAAPWQGLEVLVRAAPEVAAAVPGALFLVAGGPIPDAVRRMAAELGVESRFVWAGPQPHEDMPRYINAARVCVLPKTYSPSVGQSPLKLFEYMACARAVVASRMTGVTEVMEASACGLLVAPGRPQELARGLVTLLTDLDRAKTMGSNARRAVLESYSWGHTADLVGRTITEVLATGRGRTLAIVTDNWFSFCRGRLRSNYFLYGALLESLRPEVSRVFIYGRSKPGEADGWPTVAVRPEWEFRLEPPPGHLIVRLLRAPVAFVRFLRDLARADLVLLKFFSLNAITAYAAARLLGRPILLQVVGDPAEALQARSRGLVGLALRFPSAALHRLTGHMCRSADALWLVSSSLAARYGRDLRGIVVASESRIEPADVWSRPPGGCGRPPSLLFLGRLERIKGPDIAMEALRLLHLRGVACTLDFLGTGAMEPKLRRMAREYGLSERVRFHGWVAFGPQLWERLRSADILLLPSRTEGLPLAVLEAMASSLPVVATAVGATGDALGGRAGVVVPPEDPRALADAVEELAVDPRLFDEVARAGPQQVQWFMAAQEVARVAGLVHSLLSASRGTAAAPGARDTGPDP